MYFLVFPYLSHENKHKESWSLGMAGKFHIPLAHWGMCQAACLAACLVACLAACPVLPLVQATPEGEICVFCWA